MPNIELEPNEYARRDPRTGRMVRGLPKKWARNWLAVCAVVLSWQLFHLTGSNTLNFAFTAFWAFIGGIMAQHWLKDIY